LSNEPNFSPQWAAGFFEGEGNVGFRTYIHKTNGRPYSRLVITIAQVYREPLDTFRDIFGKGEVIGPYGPYKGSRKPYFLFSTSGDNAEYILSQMLPYLLQKREQTIRAIASYKEYVDDRIAA